MGSLIYAGITFIIIYMLYAILIIHRKNKLNNIYKSTEAIILNKVLRIDTNKIEAKKLARIVALTNAFIISVTLELILLITDKTVLQMLLAFVILILLIIIIYPVLGYFLRKKYGKFTKVRKWIKTRRF